MEKINIAEAARIMKVNKKTLMRWDKEGKFPSERAENGYRYYNLPDIQNHALWLEIRREHRAHLRKLKKVRDDVDRFISTKPLDPTTRDALHEYQEMKTAFDALRDWEGDEQRITKRYAELPEGFRHKVDAE